MPQKWRVSDKRKAGIFATHFEPEVSETDQLHATIANLTAFNESMQTDARKNTETIRELKEIAANLAKHLEAINNICEREDVDYQAWKKIRKHCEAANVMEAL